MWGAYLHNRIPRQRLEPQALALLGKHSTTELPCQLSYTSACSCYVHLSAVVMCICMQLLCASTCSCYMRLYAVVMCVWMKLSYASACSCHVHLRAVVSYTVARNSYTILQFLDFELGFIVASAICHWSFHLIHALKHKPQKTSEILALADKSWDHAVSMHTLCTCRHKIHTYITTREKCTPTCVCTTCILIYVLYLPTGAEHLNNIINC